MFLKIRHTLLLNLLLAAALTAPVLLWFNPVKHKYLAKVEAIETEQDNTYVAYCDLDFDGNCERIKLRNNTLGNGYVKIYNPGLVGQFNGNTKLFNYGNFMTCDIDNDGFKEVYYLGIRNDSVFLNQCDYKQPSFINEYLVEQVAPGADLLAHINSFADLDNDGFKEVIFNINAGFSLQPRKVYAFNTKTHDILKTPLAGSKVHGAIIEDIDLDGGPEIICGTFASRNYGDMEVPYTDMAAWVFVFDRDLGFKFPPILISEEKASVTTLPFRIKNEGYIFAFETVKNNPQDGYPYFIINTEGKIVYEGGINTCFNDNVDISPIVVLAVQNNGGKLVYIDQEGNFFRLDDDFTFSKLKKIPEFKYASLSEEIDITGNGQKEYIFRLSADNSFVIADPSLKHFTRVQLPSAKSISENISVNYQKGKKPELIIQQGVELLHIPYWQNPLWNYRFLIYVLIYGGIFGFLALLMYIQKENIKRQLFTQQQIKELQFKAVTAQLNPHFTFNALNSLSAAVYDPKNPELYDRFTTFSRLVRTMLANSDHIARSLDEEIKLTSDFVKIQQFRFKDAFTCSINVNEDVDLSMLVPKLIIQLFVENAIKHAFPNNIGKDHIDIDIQEKENVLLILVTDNGIGRKKAAEKVNQHPEKSTGLGLKLMTELIELLNRSNREKITLSVIDLEENNQSVGTRIMITIPKKYNFQ